MPDSLTFKTEMSFAYGQAQELLPGVRRLVANNPGPMTFHGTNTYLIGTTSLAVIDPGPDDESHIDNILAAAGTRPVQTIFITHRHRDHVSGVARLKAKCQAQTMAFAENRAIEDASRSRPAEREFIDTVFMPDRVIVDGDVIGGDDWRLTAVHTPGHAPDHLCFALDEHAALFSGDHVMAWNTTVIAPPEGNMAEYLSSLEKLLERTDQIFLPGHGGRIEDPKRTVRAYLLHRRMREQAILDAIRNGHHTIKALVSEIYSSVPDAVSGAAALSVLAHVELLHARGLVICAPRPALDAEIRPA